MSSRGGGSAGGGDLVGILRGLERDWVELPNNFIQSMNACVHTNSENPAYLLGSQRTAVRNQFSFVILWDPGKSAPAVQKYMFL